MCFPFLVSFLNPSNTTFAVHILLDLWPATGTDLPRTTLFNRTDSPALISFHGLLAYAGISSPLSHSPLGFSLVWVCMGLVHASPTAVNSYVQLLWPKTLFYCSRPLPLALTIFLPLLPKCSLSFGRRRKIQMFQPGLSTLQSLILCTLTSCGCLCSLPSTQHKCRDTPIYVYDNESHSKSI